MHNKFVKVDTHVWRTACFQTFNIFSLASFNSVFIKESLRSSKIKDFLYDHLTLNLG